MADQSCIFLTRLRNLSVAIKLFLIVSTYHLTKRRQSNSYPPSVKQYKRRGAKMAVGGGWKKQIVMDGRWYKSNRNLLFCLLSSSLSRGGNLPFFRRQCAPSPRKRTKTDLIFLQPPILFLLLLFFLLLTLLLLLMLLIIYTVNRILINRLLGFQKGQVRKDF